jgi:peroxiredoxin
LGLILVAFAGFAFYLAACEQEASKPKTERPIPEGPRVGFRAPNFTVPALSGNGLALSDYGGKVILINFWATWCIPCRAEMPSLEDLYSRYGGNDFEILAISGGEGEKVVHPFIDNLKLSFPILLDKDFQVHNKYQVSAIPSSYLIDRKGIITHRFFGALDWNSDQSRELIAKLMKSK